MNRHFAIHNGNARRPMEVDVVLRNMLHEAEVHSPAPLKRTLVFLGHVLGFQRAGAVVVAAQVPRTFKYWLPLSPVG